MKTLKEIFKEIDESRKKSEPPHIKTGVEPPLDEDMVSDEDSTFNNVWKRVWGGKNG